MFENVQGLYRKKSKKKSSEPHLKVRKLFKGIQKRSHAPVPEETRASAVYSVNLLAGSSVFTTALGVVVTGLVAGPSSPLLASAGEDLCRAARDLWPEAPEELRIERRALSFDHMFRADSRGARAVGS